MIFDTSLVSENMGDRIIMDYCKRILTDIFADSFVASVPTHDVIGERAYKYAQMSKYKIVCGTNLINNKMNSRRQWRISLKDTLYVDDLCLMGVGWWQYQEKKPNAYTRMLLRRLLGKNCIHSVRDEYTKKKLADIGINNVVNTACPTMWGLSPSHCEQIKNQKASKVIFTLTDYKKDIVHDKELINILQRNYSECYIWIQSFDDYGYLKQLGCAERIKTISPALVCFDEALLSGEFDYVGTRLHAGIRALNQKVRSIIIGVDNRALEISKDTNLYVVDRENIKYELEDRINQDFETMIKLPLDNIDVWKRQFDHE